MVSADEGFLGDARDEQAGVSGIPARFFSAGPRTGLAAA